MHTTKIFNENLTFKLKKNMLFFIYTVPIYEVHVTFQRQQFRFLI
jgi:hypothetical protein